MIKPELLLPAGDMQKFKLALNYGADAIYLGGTQFGLRSRANNFTEEELSAAVELAHTRHTYHTLSPYPNPAKVYVVLNAFLHDQDLQSDNFANFVRFLQKIEVDAVIISDLGVLRTVKKILKNGSNERNGKEFAIHLSTQASCLNVSAARLWKKMGVKRIVVGRELSIKETQKIKEEVGIEVEMFIHGSMCMSYSGNCTISNYTSGRDSNRGGCAHSCRFEYKLGDNSLTPTTFMSSKDLMGLELLPEFFAAGINSLKVEGRMKNAMYVGTVAKIYRESIDEYFQQFQQGKMENLTERGSELEKISPRGTCSGSLDSPAGENSVSYGKEKGEEFILAGLVWESDEDYLLVEVKNAFCPGDELQLVPFEGETISFPVEKIWSLDHIPVEINKTHPSTLVKIPNIVANIASDIIQIQPYNFLRKKRVQ